MVFAYTLLLVADERTSPIKSFSRMPALMQKAAVWIRRSGGIPQPSDTGTTELVALYDGNRHARRGESRGERWPCLTGSDNDSVKIPRHQAPLLVLFGGYSLHALRDVRHSRSPHQDHSRLSTHEWP